MEFEASVQGIIKATEYVVSGTHEPFVPGETYISPHGAYTNGKDISSLVKCALGGWFTEGKFAKDFEFQLKMYFNRQVRFVTLCNSGSSASLLAVSTITGKEFGERRLLPGDEVITTAVNFPTTVNSIIQNGAVPVFVDVDLHTYVPKMDTIEEAIIEGKTKAIFLGHTLGNCFDSERLEDLCREYGIFMITDACDALGSMYKDRHVETYGDISIHSYYPAHMITSGEGGAVMTNNPMIKKVVDSFNSWGRDCWCKPGDDNTCGKRFDWCVENLPPNYDHKYVFSKRGYNLKMTEMQASLLASQIKKLPDIVDKRRYNFMYLDEIMQEFDDWLILPKILPDAEPNWFGYPITLKSYACSFGRRELIEYLNAHKIGTRLLFAGNIIKQPAYSELVEGEDYKVHGDLYNSDIVMNYSFWLGVHPSLREEHYDYIGEVFREFFRNKK